MPSNMDALLRNTFPIYQPEYTCCKYLVNTKQTSLDETVLLSIQEIMLKLVGKKIHKHCVCIVRPVKRDWAVLSKDTPVDISI